MSRRITMIQPVRIIVSSIRWAAVFLVLCLSLPLSAELITDVTDVEIVARLTGAESINETEAVGIGGTDLGHMVNHNGRTYFLFGDTFSGANPSVGGNWRSNVMAYTTDADPSDGILFDGWITDSMGTAREVIASGRVTSPPTITEIPTGAISIGNRIYAWYMAVDWWGPPGEWTANYSGLAYWQEGDNTFTVLDGYEFPGNGNFGMVAVSFRNDPAGIRDDHLYIWGTPAGRLGGVKLARVHPDQVADQNAHQYFAGMTGDEPTWIANEFAAELVVAPTVGEMSVMYNQAAGAWTMLYLNHNTYAIELRESPEPWGPWSEPIEVITGLEAPALYGSYMNPLYVENGGETIYFTMSLWNPYDVYVVKATLEIASPLPGDFDGDGIVDGNDFLKWQQDPSVGALADWEANYGMVAMLAASSAAVPEPSSLLIAAMACLAGYCRRRWI
jgi:hypothetical protein